MKIKNVLSYVGITLAGMLITLIALQFLTPFGSSVSDNLSMKSDESAMELGSYQEAAVDDSENTTSYDKVFDKDKIIYHGSVNINVDDNDKVVEQIKSYIESINGFVESSNKSVNDDVRNENAGSIYSSLTVRVPSEKFDEAMEEIKNLGEETSSSVDSTNISPEYKDIESEKESLEIQEERLLGYLKEAEKIEDLLAIESELSNVRTQLNRINTLLQNFDRQIEYSTINVNIRETHALTSSVESPFNGLPENIRKAFISSINLLLQFFNFIILMIFRLLPFTIVMVPLIIIAKKRWKK